ncbi:hypothetical protein GCM10017567_54720 [Amycolatopsis bullii]|uniref:Uncharacterized protein n=1 Tax=Amycolatopsis bullii TaxID=941987 RepID=A0ABQ3KIJ9_9PSEU|nr:hypothetical protein GCM10017567_54720 [Amycolatopsis bullii]
MPETSGTLIRFAGAEVEAEVEVEVVVPGLPGGAPQATGAKARTASAVTMRRDMPAEYPRACPPFR